MNDKIKQIEKLMAGWSQAAAQADEAAKQNRGAVQAAQAILQLLTRDDDSQDTTPEATKKVRPAKVSPA